MLIGPWDASFNDHGNTFPHFEQAPGLLGILTGLPEVKYTGDWNDDLRGWPHFLHSAKKGAPHILQNSESIPPELL